MQRIACHLPQILVFVKQDILDKHRDSALGVLWLVLQPLAYIIIYSLVFTNLMKVKMMGFEGQAFAYTVYLVSGLLIWLMMANTLGQLSNVFQSKAFIIKKVPTSLSLMPLYIPIAETIIFVVSLFILAVMMLIMGSAIGHNWLWLPLVWLLTMWWVYPLGLLLAMFGSFLPDIRTAVPVILQLLFWLTPIVYLPSILPESIQAMIQLSPFAWATQSLQNIILYAKAPEYSWLLNSFILGFVLMLLARKMQSLLEKDIRDLL